MNITRLELLSADLEAQKDFYANILELPVRRDSTILEVKAGRSELFFTEAPEFDGGYHFAFNIPENQFHSAKTWIASRVPLLKEENGKDEFKSENWNSDSVYFKDAAGNVLEFIARHNLENAVHEDFDSRQILNISEIGLPSEDVVGLATEICKRLDVSPFRQQVNESFTPVGDEDGLLIIPVRDRIWIPNSGVPARLLSVRVEGTINGKAWEVRGVPYEITV
jgi:catechol 2,3-dioxygenase-like lactoylglutathione lyase family enzyme